MAHLYLLKNSYGTLTNVEYVLEEGTFATTRITCCNIIINDEEMAEIKIFRDDELLFWRADQYKFAVKACIDYVSMCYGK